MSNVTVARNYAEVLLQLASAKEAQASYAELLGALAATYREEEGFRTFLDTPRVALEKKQEAIREALGPDVPRELLHFLFVVQEKRRQHALPEIDEAYRSLLDEEAGRVHATVALAFEPEEDLRTEIRDGLERLLHKEVVVHFRTDPALLGGVRFRVGDRVMDGSLRRRLEDLAKEMSRTELAGR